MGERHKTVPTHQRRCLTGASSGAVPTFARARAQPSFAGCLSREKRRSRRLARGLPAASSLTLR